MLRQGATKFFLLRFEQRFWGQLQTQFPGDLVSLLAWSCIFMQPRWIGLKHFNSLLSSTCHTCLACWMTQNGIERSLIAITDFGSHTTSFVSGVHNKLEQYWTHEQQTVLITLFQYWTHCLMCSILKQYWTYWATLLNTWRTGKTNILNSTTFIIKRGPNALNKFNLTVLNDVVSRGRFRLATFSTIQHCATMMDGVGMEAVCLKP